VGATHAVSVLATETSTQEATAALDKANIRVKDAKDWATLAEEEALEQVS
jgi:hypothetical protein